MKKTNIKRFITIALAIAMIAALGACSITGHFSSTSTTTHTQETAASSEQISDAAASASAMKTAAARTASTTKAAHKTGVSFPLYYTAEITVTVYEYSDGTYRDNKGNTYTKYNAGQWKRWDGQIFGLDPESVQVMEEPTDVLFELYTISGDTVYIFEMNDGTYQDFEGNHYHKYNAGQWQREDGTILYLGTDDDCPFSDGTENAIHKTGVSFPLYYTAEITVTVYEYSDGTYRDNKGNTYTKYNAGQWKRWDGQLFGLDPESVQVMEEATDVLFELYTAGGDKIYIFEMNDGTYQDFEGNHYHKYNAGQWQSEDGTILYLGTDDDCPFSDGTEVVDCTYGNDVVC